MPRLLALASLYVPSRLVHIFVKPIWHSLRQQSQNITKESEPCLLWFDAACAGPLTISTPLYFTGQTGETQRPRNPERGV